MHVDSRSRNDLIGRIIELECAIKWLVDYPDAHEGVNRMRKFITPENKCINSGDFA